MQDLFHRVLYFETIFVISTHTFRDTTCLSVPLRKLEASSQEDASLYAGHLCVKAKRPSSGWTLARDRAEALWMEHGLDFSPPSHL